MSHGIKEIFNGKFFSLVTFYWLKYIYKSEILCHLPSNVFVYQQHLNLIPTVMLYSCHNLMFNVFFLLL